MKTYGRMGGECWTEAYQKAEEICVLQIYQERHSSTLYRVKRYLFVMISQAEMCKKQLQSLFRRLDPSASVIGTYIVSPLFFILSSATVVSVIKIGFGNLLLMVISNWVLVIFSMLTGILIREILISICKELRIRREKSKKKNEELLKQSIVPELENLTKKVEELEKRNNKPVRSNGENKSARPDAKNPASSGIKEKLRTRGINRINQELADENEILKQRIQALTPTEEDREASFQLKENAMNIVNQINQITRKHWHIIRTLEENEKLEYKVIKSEIQQAHFRAVSTYQKTLLETALQYRNIILPQINGTSGVLDERKYRNPGTLEELGEIAQDLERLILRL